MTAKKRGVFIVLEGGEGSGKSTQTAMLADAVANLGRTPLTTREPGGSPRAEEIRKVILGDESAGLDAHTEALLFAAARADHAYQTILPALGRGDVVISDRYIDSSVAYQGVGRGLGVAQIQAMSDWATQGLVPDLTVVLDIQPEVGLARASDANRLEAEPLDFHRQVRQAFLDIAETDPQRYHVVPADRSPHEVHSDLWTCAAAVVAS